MKKIISFHFHHLPKLSIGFNASRQHFEQTKKKRHKKKRHKEKGPHFPPEQIDKHKKVITFGRVVCGGTQSPHKHMTSIKDRLMSSPRGGGGGK